MIKLIFLFGVSALLATPAAAFAGSQLPHGRYAGYVKIDGREERLALQADFFIESPEDLSQFPRLEAIFKIGLGGFHTPEYLSFSYKNIRTDFDRGTLIFDEPASDMVITSKIESGEGFAHLNGKIWMRSSAVSGKIVLDLVTDEPGDEPERRPDPDAKLALAPLLDGQYVGKCDNQEAVFQIQAARALRAREQGDAGKEPFDYEVVARLGYRSKPSSGTGSRPWSSLGSFAGGSYDPFRGKLVFLGPSSTAIQCTRQVGKLVCSYRIPKSRVRCQFEKQNKDIHGPTAFARKFHLAMTADQLQPLPVPGSVSDDALAALVDGYFSGYLHHEASDRYQPVALRVVGSVSTENPHNPNKVYVSTTAVLHFGAIEDAHFISQRYEPRSFYIRPGFALNAPGTDSFIMITDWTKGAIRGVWYSQTFGRVGTVEFVKDATPTIGNAARIVKSWRGDFTGSFMAPSPERGKPPVSIERWFSVIMPNQPAERLTSAIQFVGSYQALIGLTKIEAIERGVFDPYTGALAWSFKINEGLSIVSGMLNDDGTLAMHWPPAPNAFPVAMADYKPAPFRKTDDALRNSSNR